MTIPEMVEIEMGKPDRAKGRGRCTVKILDPRDDSDNPWQCVFEYVHGGGCGFAFEKYHPLKDAERPTPYTEKKKCRR